MLTLTAAVVFASFVGSMHCVGMCGPFALWATLNSRSPLSVSAYHFGRLTTYLSAGLAAGVLGTALTIGGDIAGFQSLAAKVAGGLLIVVGLMQMLRMTPLMRKLGPTPGPSRISALVAHARPLLASRGPLGRAYLTGLLSTWLPCGWLYMFVLAAAGTGDVVAALAVMTAFWVGTLPALTVLMVGARTVAAKYSRAVPLVAALLLIVTGMYTATGRASADLSGITVRSVSDLAIEDPPCCSDPSPADGRQLTADS